MTTAMADTVARLRYAGDMRLVELKQIAREGLAAHPERVGVDGRAGGATVRRVGVHSNHSRATVVGSSDPATAVDKMVNKLGTKHHGIVAKLKQDFARSEAHRRALATTALT